MTHNPNHYVLIMAGGIGSRFWPVSKKSFPKQFMDIMGSGESLLAQTYRRFTHLVPRENIFIITNESYVGLVKEHIPNIQGDNIIEEPMARNTAPCIALATFKLRQLNPNAVCIVAPSDHLITQELVFIENAAKALNFAEKNDAILTMGIKPTRPDTGYGYIQFHVDKSENGIFPVKTFTEKPTEEIARTFIDSGEFLWNAGIFIWNLKTILQRFQQHLPEIYEQFDKLNFNGGSFKVDLERAYGLCPSISIDYGIMEKEKNVHVLPANFGWSDLGTWKSLWDVSQKDDKGNAQIGTSQKLYNTQNSLVYSNTGRLVVINGLENLVVVDSGDVLVIMDKDREQELKTIAGEIKDKYKGKYN
jgi:mannose-1-phosphate guanylyltransferase